MAYVLYAPSCVAEQQAALLLSAHLIYLKQISKPDKLVNNAFSYHICVFVK